MTHGTETAKDQLPATEKEIARSDKSFLEHALGGTVILSALTGVIFLLGWAYLSAYYGSFGVSLTALDVSLYTFLSIAAIASVPSLLDLLLVLFLLSFVVALPWKPKRETASDGRWKRYFGRWLRVSKPLIFPSVVVLSVGVAAGRLMLSAQTEARLDYEYRAEKVQLTFKSTASAVQDLGLRKANDAGALRFLAQTKDLVIVFEKPSSASISAPRSVFLVSRADLAAVHSWYSPNDTAVKRR